MKDSFSQQIQLRTTVHLSLKQLQSRDLSLDLTVAPFLCHGVPGDLPVALQSLRERPQIKLTGTALCQPVVKLFRRAVAYHRLELLGPFTSGHELGVLPNTVHRFPFLLCQFTQRVKQQS